MKACRDCKFFYADEGSSCSNPEFKVFDPVWGWQSQFPAKLREKGAPCGPEAVGFQEKRKSRFWGMALCRLVVQS